MMIAKARRDRTTMGGTQPTRGFSNNARLPPAAPQSVRRGLAAQAQTPPGLIAAQLRRPALLSRRPLPSADACPAPPAPPPPRPLPSTSRTSRGCSRSAAHGGCPFPGTDTARGSPWHVSGTTLSLSIPPPSGAASRLRAPPPAGAAWCPCPPLSATPLPRRRLLPARSCHPLPPRRPPASRPAQRGAAPPSLPIHPASGEAAAEAEPAGRRSALSAAVSEGRSRQGATLSPQPAHGRPRPPRAPTPRLTPLPRIPHSAPAPVPRLSPQPRLPQPFPRGQPLCRLSPQRPQKRCFSLRPLAKHTRTGRRRRGPAARPEPRPPLARRPPAAPPAPGCASPRATSQALRSWE